MRKGRKVPRQHRRPLALALAAALLLGIGLWAALGLRASPAGAGPRIALDSTRHDFGRVPYELQVSHSFTFRNEGDAPLTVDPRPIIEVLEGC